MPLNSSHRLQRCIQHSPNHLPATFLLTRALLTMKSWRILCDRPNPHPIFSVILRAITWFQMNLLQHTESPRNPRILLRAHDRRQVLLHLRPFRSMQAQRRGIPSRKRCSRNYSPSSSLFLCFKRKLSSVLLRMMQVSMISCITPMFKWKN